MEKTIILHPMYYGSIAQYVAIAQATSICFEEHDNFQKQTYRNRTYIYGANGKLMLSIPIKHTGNNGRQLYKDVKIENDFPWQSQHWKSLETAYRTSPFFEYYEAEFLPLYQKKRTFLLDFNYECQQIVFDCLQIQPEISKTEAYQAKNNQELDLRNLVNSKKEKEYDLENYIQVFLDKFGFIKNLSILDLIFNEGTNALHYLENQELNFTDV